MWFDVVYGTELKKIIPAGVKQEDMGNILLWRLEGSKSIHKNPLDAFLFPEGGLAGHQAFVKDPADYSPKFLL